MWCLIENKKILFFDGEKSRLADKLKEKLSEISLEELSDDEDISWIQEKIKNLGKKLIQLYNCYDGILEFDS